MHIVRPKLLTDRIGYIKDVVKCCVMFVNPQSSEGAQAGRDLQLHKKTKVTAVVIFKVVSSTHRLDKLMHLTLDF